MSSVLCSADTDTLVTVVDDGSPGDEVAATASRHQVDYVKLPHNHGVAGVFQRCARDSRGDYTVIMGSDDLMESWYVEEIRRLLERFPEAAMAMPRVTVIDGSGAGARPMADRVKGILTPRGNSPILLGGDAFASSLLTGNWLYFPAIAWRTDLLRSYGFRQDMQTALDLDLELRLVFAGETLAWSPRPSFRYRRHDASASSLQAVTGRRFDEEDALYRWAQRAAAEAGWRRSSLAAQLHLTSRLHRVLARRRPARRRSGRGSA